MIRKLTKLLDKIPNLKPTNASMKYIVWYAVMLVFCCTVWLIGWFIEWFITGKPNLSELLQFLHEVSSAGWIAVIGFCAKSFVDRNKDNIPDSLEDDQGNLKK
jgi:hypothetical protein